MPPSPQTSHKHGRAALSQAGHLTAHERSNLRSDRDWEPARRRLRWLEALTAIIAGHVAVLGTLGRSQSRLVFDPRPNMDVILVEMAPVRLFFATLCLTLLATVPASADEACQPRGQPIVWATSDADTTVFLVGTVHRLQRGEYVPPAALTPTRGFRIAAFESRSMSFLGTLRVAIQARSGRDLEQALTDEQWAKLQGLSDRLGVPRFALQRLDPFLLAGTLEERAVGLAGRDNPNGADAILKEHFDRDGVEIRYLEDQRDIFDLIRGFSYQSKVDFLIDMITLLESDQPSSLVDAWLIGDDCAVQRQAEGFARYAEENPSYHEIHQGLVTDRNRRFADQIETMLEIDGQHVVAVGALHFYGPMSIREMLQSAGHPVVEVR